ncbi:hypothetical protein N5079_18805 [Planotetraspora sp. A-T 1434]|uniref:hypothetical protein n=1 Tax=Planotetraspora sp. A-T 1434 TaxID=2979219 RepID=UPI0021C09EC6|nr:hypothetical protein [Planotetraspora sp. A-T 1434]MCT9932254.1 hypothetical protein [Planotetraspora sp. A-T 1434]
MEAQTAPERDAEAIDLVGAADQVGSRQHVRAVDWLAAVREQYGNSRISDIALVNDSRARHIRTRHHVARS